MNNQNNYEQQPQYNPYAQPQGNPYGQPQYNPYGQPQSNPFEQPYGAYAQPAKQPSFAPPLLSFIFGLIGLFCIILAFSDRDLEPFFGFAIIFAIPSTVTGIIGLVNSIKAKMTNGIIFAAIGLVGAFLSTIIPFFNL